jgi:AraC-like DNA-binding protein
MEPVIKSRILVGLEPYMASRGLDFAELAERAGVRITKVLAEDDFMPLQPLLTLLELAATASGDDLFGAHFGEQFPSGLAGIFHYIVLNSPTIGDALRACAHFARLTVSAGDITFVEIDGDGFYTWYFPDNLAHNAQFIGFSVALTINRISAVLQKPWVPKRVDLEVCQPRSLCEVRRLMGENLRFDARPTRIVVDAADLDAPTPPKNVQLLAELCDAATRTLDQQGRIHPLVQQVTDAILAGLPFGKSSEADICATLSISSRTLQRALGEKGETFKELFDDTRKQKAYKLIMESVMPLTEVAFLLGFSELSAFSRASKQWFGEPPSRLRQKTI